jgi:hypothetical protein
MGFLGIRLGLPMQSSGAAAAAVAYRPLGVTVTNECVLKYAGGFTPSPNGLLIVGIRGNVGSGTANLTKEGVQSLMNKNFIGNINATGSTNSEENPGMNWTLDNSGAGGTCVVRANLIDATGGPAHNTLGVYGPPSIINSSWQLYAWAYDTNQVNGQKKQTMYKDGVRVMSATTDGGGVGAFDVGLTNNGWFINAQSAGQSSGWGDVFRVWFHTPASMTGIIEGSAGNWSIAASVLAKIFDADGGPMDLGTDGSTLLGVQPLVFNEVRPGGVPADFVTNRGSAGNPTQIGTNTYSSTPFKAALQPYVAADRPYLVDWSSGNTGWSAGTANGTNATVPSYGIPININDKLLMMVAFSNQAADSAHAPTIAGWTEVEPRG